MRQSFNKLIEVSIEDVFREYYLHIPAYQRPYAWEEEHVSDLWLDIEQVIKIKESHYIGPMYFTSSTKANHLNVTDGQQRLTSFTLLFLAFLRAINDIEQNFDKKAYANELKVLKDDLQSMLFDPDGNTKLSLGSSDKEAFGILLNNYLTIELNEKDWEDEFKRLNKRYLTSAQNLFKNYIYFLKKIYKLNEYKIDDGSEEESDFELDLETIKKQLKATIKKYKLYFDQIKSNFYLVQIIIEDKSDLKPFKLFETINDRGKQLDQVDKVKNYLFKNVYRVYSIDNQSSQYKKHYENVRAKWSEIQKVLDSDIEDYIRYFIIQSNWINKFVKKSNLYEELHDHLEKTIDGVESLSSTDQIRKYKELADKSIKLIDELDNFKEDYLSIIDPKTKNYVCDITKANYKYAANYTIIRALLLKILLTHKTDKVKIKKLTIIATNLAMLYVSIYGMKKLDTVEKKIYEDFLRDDNVIRSEYKRFGTYLIQTLQNSDSDFDLKKAVLKDKIERCTNDLVAYYTQIKLNDYLNNTPQKQDFFYPLIIKSGKSSLNKDHILPTNYTADYRIKIVDYYVSKGMPVPSKKQIKETIINSIGNIVPLKQGSNKSKGNSPFPLAEYNRYTNPGILVKQILESNSVWMIDEIQKRSETIAEQVIEYKALSFKYEEVEF